MAPFLQELRLRWTETGTLTRQFLSLLLIGDTLKQLQEAQLPLIPKFQCQLLYGYVSYLLPEMLCAGDIANVKNVCEVRPILSDQSWALVEVGDCWGGWIRAVCHHHTLSHLCQTSVLRL